MAPPLWPALRHRPPRLAPSAPTGVDWAALRPRHQFPEPAVPRQPVTSTHRGVLPTGAPLKPLCSLGPEEPSGNCINKRTLKAPTPPCAHTSRSLSLPVPPTDSASCHTSCLLYLGTLPATSSPGLIPMWPSHDNREVILSYAPLGCFVSLPDLPRAQDSPTEALWEEPRVVVHRATVFYPAPPSQRLLGSVLLDAGSREPP